MDKLLLSAVIPCYNFEKYIEDAVDSILSQNTTFRFQIYLIDDCSTDNTFKIIKNKYGTIPNVNIFQSKKNQGITNNLSEIFEKITTEYIFLIDGDDYLIDNSYLQRAIDFLEENKNFSMYCTGYKQLNNDGLFHSDTHVLHSDIENITFEDILSTNHISMARVFRNYKNLIKNWINDEFHEDWLINSEILKYGPARAEKNFSAVYRITNSGRLTSLTNKQIDEKNKKTIEIIYEKIKTIEIINNDCDVTLISVSDGKNIEASKKSMLGFRAYNSEKIIAVNTQHSYEFQKMCTDIGVEVFTPNKKLGYPAYDENEDVATHMFDWFYNTIIKPAMLSETKYIMFAEPDCIFTNKINNNVLVDEDIIVPTDMSELKVNWAFNHFWWSFGINDEEKTKNINGFFNDFKLKCEKINLNFDTAADNDMRFVFMANSIFKREKLCKLFNTKKEDIKYLINSIVECVKKNRSNTLDILSERQKRAITIFSTDHIISIILGLYLFNWKINDNGLNCVTDMFLTEEDLKKYLENKPNTEYIHSCKIYYNKIYSLGKNQLPNYD